MQNSISGLYLFEEVGVLLEVHGGLVLGNGDTDFLAGTKMLELGSNRGQVAVSG
ncbi:hypothetical protein LQZ21_09655 [Treponema sp. TIM-1]|uniref:hypothetical protein n=1 Tax=Treponema sp. TIM-1 TaxID=2898417 RepID=UPI003980FCA5